MKTQLLFALLFVLFLGNIEECYGQNELSFKPLKDLFKPLKDFGDDTTAYMEKNYAGAMIGAYEGRTIEDILKNEKDVPFKSFIIYQCRTASFADVILLFTISADELKALYKPGEPIFGVSCTLHAPDRNELNRITEDLSRIGIGKVFDLKKTELNAIKDFKLDYAWYYDLQKLFTLFDLK